MARRKPNIAVWRDAILSDCGPEKHTERLVALALSKHSGSTGGAVWPSQELLAVETGLGLRTVRRATDGLEKQHWIQRNESRTSGRSWRRYTYTLKIPEGEASLAAASDKGAATVAGKVRPEMPHVRTKVRPESPRGAARVADEQEIEQETAADDSARKKSTEQKPRVRTNGTPATPEAHGLLMAAWREQAGTPSRAEQNKQAAAAKRIANAHPPERIEHALAGLPRLFPYSNGTPWDVFDLERAFSKAAAQGEREAAESGSDLTAAEFFALQEARERGST